MSTAWRGGLRVRNRTRPAICGLLRNSNRNAALPMPSFREGEARAEPRIVERGHTYKRRRPPELEGRGGVRPLETCMVECTLFGQQAAEKAAPVSLLSAFAVGA